MALGAYLPDGSLGLRSFEGTSPASIESAGRLLEQHAVHVEVDAEQTGLLVDVTVVREGGVGRAVLAREHTRLVRLERDGLLVGGADATEYATEAPSLRQEVAALSIQEVMELARTLDAGDRARLQEGVAFNLAIARHGLSLLPGGFVAPAGMDSQTRLSRLVSAGVFARMSGESRTVMTLAGSGNKGITVAVPVSLWGRETGHLGTLSAICGAANAAGIGIAAALVLLQGGDARQVGLAVSNMVGNVAGMICDGAKIGCAMKTMTGVDAAFRSATLAMAGIGIPATDGIVGKDGESSLVNLGRLAQHGMAGVDAEILRIMQDKLRRSS